MQRMWKKYKTRLKSIKIGKTPERSEGEGQDMEDSPVDTVTRMYTASENFPVLATCHGDMAKHLTFDMYSRLYNKVTPNGYTLDAAIQYGVDMERASDRAPGVVAGDEETYEVFKELLDKVIESYHDSYLPGDVHTTNLEASQIEGGVFDTKYVKSCRVRTMRNIQGMLLSTTISRAERRKAETVMTNALSALSGNLKGTYFPLSSLSPDTAKQLSEEHLFMDKSNSNFHVSSGMVRDWPHSRGIWHNEDKTVIVWLNEEDHARVISMQKGGDLKEAFSRFCSSLIQIETEMKKNGLQFMWNPHLGYIATCPSNLGTGLRASVLIQLEHLPKKSEFPKILAELKLQKRGTFGEDTPVLNHLYDISNKARLGKSEVELVQLVVDGVNQLIAMETQLEAGNDIDDMMPWVDDSDIK